MTIKTLAELISTTRENRGLSQLGLAIKANVPLKLIENIESGQDLFLAATIRQKLARVLRLEPVVIKLLEKTLTGIAEIDTDYIEILKIRIKNGELENKCPLCQSDLICKIEVMYDIEDNEIKHPKAKCSKCVFQLK